MDKGYNQRLLERYDREHQTQLFAKAQQRAACEDICLEAACSLVLALTPEPDVLPAPPSDATPIAVWLKIYPWGSQHLYAADHRAEVNLILHQTGNEDTPAVPEGTTEAQLRALGFVLCEDILLAESARNFFAYAVGDA